MRLFSKKPIRTLADLQAANLYTTEGDPKTVQWYAQNGFHAVPLATSEIPKQLKLPTGSINAAPSPPALAAALQFFKDAPYMLDLRLGPLAAATVMTDARVGEDLGRRPRQDPGRGRRHGNSGQRGFTEAGRSRQSMK